MVGQTRFQTAFGQLADRATRSEAIDRTRTLARRRAIAELASAGNGIFTMATTERRTFLLEFEKPLAELEGRIQQIRDLATENGVDVSDQIHQLEARASQLRQEIFSSLSPYQRLQLARHPRRPSTLDYIQAIADEWMELHGDRRGNDDPALVGGIGRVGGIPVVILGHQKGRDTKDNVARNFGMASPGGYRKAMRLMEHANRFGMPIFTFIDTPGAWAGIEAEHQGQGEAIAYNLREMFRLDVPIVSTVIGEGGSGGALGIGVADRLLMLEHAVYTVATPEACAAILWKDAAKASQAAEALKITSWDLKNLGILDRLLPEPVGGAHSNPLKAAETLKEALLSTLEELSQLTSQQRREQRYQKFRRIGVFMELPA
jgi:acetyl-CoA carboxylase carboxyl transferase subunit alpha